MVVSLPCVGLTNSPDTDDAERRAIAPWFLPAHRSYGLTVDDEEKQEGSHQQDEDNRENAFHVGESPVVGEAAFSGLPKRDIDIVDEGLL
jgi:hypothetical protein